MILTYDGEALHRDLLSAIQAANANLIEPFDTRDLKTTIRMLQAVTSRAQAMQPQRPGTATS